MTQRMIEILSPVFVREDQLPAGEGLDTLFSVARPLALEIGCGIGDFVVELARRQPERNFLAIDIYNKGCHRTCRRVELAGLDNVRVLRMEARYLLHHYLREGELAAIYINCPDPWPKKRHRRRRLVNDEFLQLALHYLRPEGELFFVTDFADYARQVAALAALEPGFDNCLEGPWRTELPGYPLSKYMRRFRREGLPLHFIHLRRRIDVRVCPDAATGPRQGFRLRWGAAPGSSS